MDTSTSEAFNVVDKSDELDERISRPGSNVNNDNCDNSNYDTCGDSDSEIVDLNELEPEKGNGKNQAQTEFNILTNSVAKAVEAHFVDKQVCFNRAHSLDSSPKLVTERCNNQSYNLTTRPARPPARSMRCGTFDGTTSWQISYCSLKEPQSTISGTSMKKYYG